MSNSKTKQNIPKGWQRVKLGDFGITLGGLSGKKKENFGHGKPFIPYMNIFRNSHIDKNFVDLVEIKHGEKQNQLQYGDYLFTTSSETPDEVGMSSVVNTDLGEMYLNSFCFIFRPNDKSLDPSFGGYLFRGRFFRKEIATHAKGSTRFNLSKRDFLGVEIVFPESEREQKKIAVILSVVDEEIQKTDEIISATEKLKRGLMRQLFTRGIGHTKFKKTEIGEIPVEWDLSKLRDVAKFTNGKAHEKDIKEDGKYIVINSKFISTNGGVIKRSDKNLSPLVAGDMAMVMSDIPKGKALAKCFLVEESNKYTLNQRICLLRAIKMADKFLYYVLNRNPYFLGFDNGVGQTNLRKDEVLGCPVQVPPESEQRKIVELLSSVDGKISINQKLKTKLTILKKGLMQDLLSGKVIVPTT